MEPACSVYDGRGLDRDSRDGRGDMEGNRDREDPRSGGSEERRGSQLALSGGSSLRLRIGGYVIRETVPGRITELQRCSYWLVLLAPAGLGLRVRLRI